jgi:deoxyribodipyrimidine photo-lyase
LVKNIPAAEFPKAPIIVWFRNDLRVRDNLALLTAAASGRAVVPVFILDDKESDMRALGGAQRWWLHHSLTALSNSLDALDSKLVLRRAEPLVVLNELISDTGAKTVLWNRRYAPDQIKLDTTIKQALRDSGIVVESFGGRIMHEPTQVKTGSGGPYRVYTPFWRAFSEMPDPRPPADSPQEINAYEGNVASDKLEDWSLLPEYPDWADGLREEWTPGEDGARQRLGEFLENALSGYAANRDIPSAPGTSKLSPHLAFGEISPFRIWEAMECYRGDTPSDDFKTFRKELVWREFSYHLLVNFPDLRTRNYNDDFDAFPWADSDTNLETWQKGLTGYPVVDAGMRQLWQTGWMHNRVRMIVSSFLVKHLLIDWRRGEEWFWDTLVDADPASNTASWQWVAGSGADASPYFRIFNPILQGEKFDPDGEYVKRFVPELAGLPKKFIHKPWEAPISTLRDAGVKLGVTYPRPVIEHKHARERALAAYQSMKGNAA